MAHVDETIFSFKVSAKKVNMTAVIHQSGKSNSIADRAEWMKKDKNEPPVVKETKVFRSDRGRLESEDFLLKEGEIGFGYSNLVDMVFHIETRPGSRIRIQFQVELIERS